MFCGYCGAKLPDDARFCSACGKPTAGAATPPAPAPTPAPVPAPAPAPSPVRKLYLRHDRDGFAKHYFTVIDQNGNSLYEAVVTERIMKYSATLSRPDGTQVATLQQMAGLTALNFVMQRPDGTTLTELKQKPHFGHFDYHLPQYGIIATSQFLAVTFQINQNGVLVADATKVQKEVNDAFMFTFADPALEVPLIGLLLAVEITHLSGEQRRAQMS
ncbi:MAG: zinc ribbon domain-containing protein [Clostridia bacterium]|nr:zinc ribbon domain-containing protein [Clostridia bacterium]